MKYIKLLLLCIVFIGVSRAQNNNFDNILLIINYNHPHYESIPLLQKVYGAFFKNIVFYGPTQHEGVHFYPHHQGYLSYLCIGDAMERYPNFDGYLFLMDDCILNAWMLDGLDQSKIWFSDISYMKSSRGNPIDIRKKPSSISGWWNTQWGYQRVITAFDNMPYPYRQVLAQNWGSFNVVAAYSDIVYIPARFKNQFIELAIIFGINQAFLEIALPTIISCLCLKNDWLWLRGNGTDRKDVRKDFKSYVYFNHPLKLSDPDNQSFVLKIFEPYLQQTSKALTDAPWFTEIKDNKMFRFNYNAINALLAQAQSQALAKYNEKQHKFFITDDNNLNVNGFIRKNNIDEIDTSLIQESLFLVFFHTDDDYVYTLKKIKDYHGIFYSLPHFVPKTRYLWVDKNAMKAVDNAFAHKISHQNVDVHETICLCLNATKNIPGDYVEIGVYMGGSALTALGYMKYSGINRKSYFLDTFNGMTYAEAHQSSDVIWDGTHVLWGVQDTMNYVKGILNTAQEPYELVESNICQNQLPADIKQIAVCNIDVDLYDATLAALVKVAPLVVKGGIIICEDPTSTPGLGGALVAMEEFLATPDGKKFMKILANAQYLLIKMEN